MALVMSLLVLGTLVPGAMGSWNFETIKPLNLQAQKLGTCKPSSEPCPDTVQPWNVGFFEPLLRWWRLRARCLGRFLARISPLEVIEHDSTYNIASSH